MDVRVYSGAHMLEKNQLLAVRTHINDNLKQFNALVTNKDFTGTFSQILGEKNKRVPAEFAEAEKQQPLIANKNFYWYFKLEPTLLLKDDLVDQLVSRYKKTMPLNHFFEEALTNA
jgi:uncharacterized protein (DUF2461 family)